MSTSSSSGTVFLDIVFTGMLGPPSGGREVWTDGHGLQPGGRRPTSRSRAPGWGCGPRWPPRSAATSTATSAGDCSSEAEGIDLSHSQRFEGWHSPVTVSLAFDDDRAMVTHGHPATSRRWTTCSATSPTSRLCFFDAGAAAARPVARPGDRAPAALVFADVGWDATEQLGLDRAARAARAVSTRSSPTPTEAMAYTRTESPGAALGGAARPGPARRRDGRQRRRLRGRRRDRRDGVGARPSRSTCSTRPAPVTCSSPR